MKNCQSLSLALTVGAGTTLWSPFVVAYASSPSHLALNEVDVEYHPEEVGPADAAERLGDASKTHAKAQP